MMEDQMDYAAMDCPPATEIEEWTNLAKETLDAAAGKGKDPKCTTLETIVVCFAYLATTINSRKAVTLVLCLSGTGTTRVLFNCICDSGHVNLEILGDNKFAQHRMVNPAILFNKGGPAAATMMPHTPVPEEEDKEDNSANPGSPSPKCPCLIPNLRIARPKNFSDTQLNPNYTGWLVQATNCHAVTDCAGSGTYMEFVPFDLPVLYKCVGLLFANFLTPKPQLE
jgi:hypothetical protein